MLHSSQLDLFKPVETSSPEVIYVDHFLEDHDKLFRYLSKNISWNHKFKSRKTAMFGVSYGYDGDHYKYNVLPEFLVPLSKQINQRFGYLPNSCLINNYPDGKHYISYHSDRDMEMNDHTGVTIVSLGTVREMAFRSSHDTALKCYYALQPGSAIYMDDAVQQNWQHGVPKTTTHGQRISLSFRSLVIR